MTRAQPLRLATTTAALVIVASACLPDTTPPPGARIACQSDADCPETLACRSSLGLCVFVDGEELTPPSVSDVAIVGERVGLGGEVVVSFEVSRPLVRDPLVELVLPSGRVPFRLRAGGGRSYELAYAASGLEPEGAAQVLVSVVDSHGNEATDVALGTVTFDFTRPQATEVSLEPAAVKAGTSTTLTFRVSEALAEPPAVRFVDGGAWLLVAEPEPLVYRFRYDADGTEVEGEASVVVELVDEAGNDAARTLEDALRLDFTPPTVTHALLRDAVRAGQTVAVEVSASEALAAPPVVTLVPASGGASLPLAVGAQVGNAYTFRRQITAGDGDGEYDVVLAPLEDLAGNSAGAAVALGTLTVDNVAPAAEPGATVTPALAREGTTVTATFTATEALAAPPRVTLGGVEMTLVTTSGESYTLEHAVSGDEGEGVRSVAVELVDAAGNLRTETIGDVVLDFRPPDVALATIAYTPAADSPLHAVTKAADGTRITVTLVASEPISVDESDAPTLTAHNGTDTLAFTVATLHSGGVTFEAYPAGLDDGVYVPSLSWSDRAGNRAEDASFATPVIEVKTSEPVLAVAQEQLRYVRSPWGNAVAEQVNGVAFPAGPYFALAPADPLGPDDDIPGDTFSLVGGGAPSLVRVWASQARDTLLGALSLEDDGAWPRQRLVSQDALAVWVTGVDEAGNESAPVRVSRGEWVATSNPPTFGATPHRLRGLPAANASPAAPGAIPFADEAAGSDGAAAFVRARPSWRVPPFDDENPSARYDHAMAWDDARGRAVLLGGRGDGRQRDTWEWDGERWLDVTPPSEGPGKRESHALAYDAARGRVVLFGGWDDTFRGDTWEWDGERWLDVTPAGASPSGRAFHSLTYDSARGVVLLYGGLDDDGGYLDDLWSWDGERWTEVTAQGATPAGRFLHAAAYDAVRARMVVHGGEALSGDLDDTWEWDGATWHDVTPAGSKPAARQLHAMAYDRERERVVLFGGYDYPTDTQLDDTWEWDGAAWREVTGTAERPSARDDHALVYDSVSGRVLLFGGWGGGDLADTWAFDGERWSELTPLATQPSARQLHVMAYDEERERVVLFGGSRMQVVRDDTWEWDGARWREMTSGGALPPAREAAALAYDGVGGGVLLFGGFSGTNTYHGDTWRWDGQAWIDVTPASGGPPARSEHAMAYDRARGRLVVFGGSNGVSLDDTWEWDGSAWTEVIPSGARPPRRLGHGMAYDEARGRVVLFGGTDSSADKADLWEWDGSAWTEVPPAGDTPGARAYPALGYDSRRERVVLVGGCCSGDAPDAWEWDGAGWTATPFAGPTPSKRIFHAMAYDAARGEMIFFGGNDGIARGDTWTWASRPDRQPAIQLAVSAAASGIEPSSLESVVVRAHAGGSFSPYDAGATGATLYAWRTRGLGSRGGFVPLASNVTGVSPSQPHLPAPPGAALAATIPFARDLFVERDASLTFEVRPAGESGSRHDAAVALDYLEVRVRYALP